MKEWFLTFSEEHMILAMLLRILLAIIIIIVGIAIVGILCAGIYAIFKRIVGLFNGVNEKLDKVCEPCNKSSNPWGMVIALGWAAIFYFAPQVSSREVTEFWSSEVCFGFTRYQFGGVIILSLVVLVGLMSAKLRYPVVLFVKLVRIPLDLISFPFRLVYMVSGIVGSLTGAIKPVEGIVYLNGAPGSQGGGAGAGVRRGYRKNIGYRYVSGASDSTGSGSGETGSRDGFAYLGEKYDQQRAADAGGANGYEYTTTEQSSTQFYTGDYRPYSETGETVESYHLDEGMMPMDND